MYKRHYFKWNINELIALQREYELLEMTIQEIAIKHQRSVKAILCRLQQENFIQNWEEATGFEDYVRVTPELEHYICEDDDNESSISSDSESETNSIESYESAVESVESCDSFEPNYIANLDNIGFALSIKQFMHDLSNIVKKFTNITGNSHNNNLNEL
jgi:ribosomal protein S8